MAVLATFAHLERENEDCFGEEAKGTQINQGRLARRMLHELPWSRKAVKAREGEKRRRWLNRAAAASVCVLKNGDYDLGQEYFDPDLNRFQPKLQALLIGNLFTPSVRRHFL